MPSGDFVPGFYSRKWFSTVSQTLTGLNFTFGKLAVDLGDEREECSTIAKTMCTVACVYAVFWEAVSLIDGEGAIAQVIESVTLELKQLYDRVPDAMAVLVAYTPRGVSAADLVSQTRDVSAAVVHLVMEQRSSGPHGLRMWRQRQGEEDYTLGWEHEQEQEQEQDVSVIVLHEGRADDADLRGPLLHMAERLSFAKYPVPASYHRLRDLVAQIRRWPHASPRRSKNVASHHLLHLVPPLKAGLCPSLSLCCLFAS